MTKEMQLLPNALAGCAHVSGEPPRSLLSQARNSPVSLCTATPVAPTADLTAEGAPLAHTPEMNGKGEQWQARHHDAAPVDSSSRRGHCLLE